jgi:hypothetical protein
MYDVIHGHRNLLQARRPDSIVFTVLRDPVARSLSLFFDLASLSEADIAHLQGPTLAYRRDCLEIPFTQLRKKWSHSQLFLGQHADYMCRFFLRNDVTEETFLQMSSKERFRRALASIERDVTAFGLTEQMDKSIHHFSQVLGLFPRQSLPGYNLARSKGFEITADDRRYLESITAGDRMLWEHCTKKFEEIRVDYSVATFESVRLSNAIRAIVVKRRGDSIIYDMNSAFIGEGFWGRERPGEPECCRWSGPSDDSVVYLPCPQDAAVEVALNVAGWVHRGARSSFRVKVWGELAAHAFSAEEGLAHVVRFRAAPRNGVLKLEFHSVAKTDEECSASSFSQRKSSMLAYLGAGAWVTKHPPDAQDPDGARDLDRRRKGFLLKSIALLPESRRRPRKWRGLFK